MSGLGALRSEVIFGFDNSFSEVGLPHAIHGDAGSERIAWVYQPLGEVEARSCGGGQRRKDGGNGGLHDEAFSGEIATEVDVTLAGLGQLARTAAFYGAFGAAGGLGAGIGLLRRSRQTAVDIGASVGPEVALAIAGVDVRVLHGEEHFFMSLRDKTTMEAPRGYWAKADDRSWRSIAVMEDIAATKGARFIGPTERLTHERIRAICSADADRLPAGT